MLRKTLLSFVSALLFLLFSTAYAESVKELFHQPGDPVIGNPKGSVTIVEFFDYQCSHCVSMAPVIDAIVKANPNVRVVFKDYPIRGPMSEFAARAAIAANKQGKYYEFSHALLASDEALTQDSIFSIAKKVGLNVTQLKKDMDSESVKNVLRNTIHLAEELNITGTPAFFIGKTNAKNSNDIDFIYGELSQSELQSEINKDG